MNWSAYDAAVDAAKQKERYLEARIRELEEENARLRALAEKLGDRVGELEAHWRDFMQWDESAVLYNWKQKAEAAEARLAKVIKIHTPDTSLSREWCGRCDEVFPCETYVAAKGEHFDGYMDHFSVWKGE